jgi:putative hemin transport protein
MADAPDPALLRTARADDPKARDRDLALKLGVSEAQLLAAHVGAEGGRVLPLSPDPNRLIPAVEGLGEVMALTRNDSAVSERVGRYGNFRPGEHAAIVAAEEIDLRIFPAQWTSAFAVERLGEGGPRRSLQVFDRAGDSVHKVHLREGSDLVAWEALVAALALPDPTDRLAVEARPATAGPKADPARRDALRKEWVRMTDTHQFMRLTGKLGMNRLGAYRIAGEDLARPLAPTAISAMLDRVSAQGLEVMVFVGNRGCIQIHSGRLDKLLPMGPWLNVMDPRFNLHLRGDHVAEVWAVEKPTKRGAALSVEAFDAEGALILQVFPSAREERDHREPWARLVSELPALEPAEEVLS